MKKIILIALVVIANNVMAQKQKLIQKINVGAFASTVAITNFSNSSKPFSLGYNLCPIVTAITKKTAHSIFYGTADNSINTLNAYFLPKNWDTYVVYSRNLNSKGNYLAFGVEKMEKVGNLKFFEFAELGTGFHGAPILSFGLLLNVSWALKK